MSDNNQLMDTILGSLESEIMQASIQRAQVEAHEEKTKRYDNDTWHFFNGKIEALKQFKAKLELYKDVVLDREKND